jgi:hypothetical protein
MATNDQIISRWVARMRGTTARPMLKPRGNVFAEGDRLYSYGMHFEMARALRDKRGKLRLFLLNGDRHSPSTDRHQRALRDAIPSTVPSVIIPYRALNAANIEFDSIVTVDVSVDRMETWTDTYDEMPAGAQWSQPYRHMVEQPVSHWVGLIGPRNKEAHWVDGLPPKWDDRAHMGGQEMVVDFPGVFAEYRSLYLNGKYVDREWVDDHLVYSIQHWRHHLGESVIKARVPYWTRDRSGERVRRSRVAYFLSGFDTAERRPSYFFCELPPGARPTTVAEAYECLKPATVKAAEELGREVKRQGDVYAVPVPSITKRELTKQGATFAKADFILGVNHRATEVARLTSGMTLVRGTLTHDPGRWRSPDHRRVTVGKQWHVVIKNLVPLK